MAGALGLPGFEAPTPAEVKGEKAKQAYSNQETLSGLRLPAEMETDMDAAFEAIPNELRGISEIPKKPGPAPKGETPPDVTEEEAKTEEQPAEVVEPAPVESETKPDPAYEAALTALSFDKVPQSVIEKATKEQILEWGSKAKERQDSVAAKLRSAAEEAKRAQESATKPTEKTESPKAPTEIPELDATLKAFDPYGEDFTKAQREFGRAAVEAARKATIAEFQPAAAMLMETQTVVREILNDSMRREFGERFPEPVRQAKLKEAEATALRLWKANPDLAADNSRSYLDRYRECFGLACKTLQAEPPKPVDEGKSRRQAQGLPSSPGKKMPNKAKTLDDDIDAGFEEVQARWASR
jgi:hypothetical protein